MNEATRLVFVTLSIPPAPLSIEAAHAAVVALAGLSGQPQIVIETFGSNRHVRWRIGMPVRHRHQVIEVLRTHLPGLVVDEPHPPLPAGPRADVATKVRVRSRSAIEGSLAHESTESVTRGGVLGALAVAGRHESVYLQVILGPRKTPQLPPQQLRGGDRTLAVAKLREFRFAAPSASRQQPQTTTEPDTWRNASSPQFADSTPPVRPAHCQPYGHYVIRPRACTVVLDDDAERQ